MIVATYAFAVVFAATVGSLCAAPPERIDWLTAKPFQQALAAPISATWENVDLRTITRRVATTRRTSILLDRRIDPSRDYEATASNQSLLGVLQDLSHRAGGQASVVGNTIYVGPPEATGKLRTLVALRQKELQLDDNEIPRTRRFALTEAQTFEWNDLDRPVELLQRVAASRELKIEGLEEIPHDLWSGGVIPQASAAETLSLLLIQWDLTFGWTEHGRGIRLVPVPEHVVIAREHLPPRGVKAAQALKQWQEEFEGLTGRINAGGVVVEATLEQHEAIEQQKRPGKGGTETPKPKPLKQERFTLRIKDAPASSLIKKLSEPAYGQLSFEYDADELKSAGIDLDRRVTFEVNNAPIEQLLKAVLEPLGVTFELDDRTVRLKPARSKP